MAAKQKQGSTSTYAPRGGKVHRKGIHAKTKVSSHKASKNYSKSYKGQGR